MLKCENLVKVYSGCRAVDGLNLELDAGRIYALLGPNGSGKSTFMKMVHSSRFRDGWFCLRQTLQCNQNPAV